MASLGAALFLVALVPVAAILRGTSNGMDLSLALNDMHPAQVGKLLNTVELKWEEARVSSLRSLTDEKVGLEDMVKSCSKVAKAIIAGSDGDKDKVVEYMQDVCSSDNAPPSDEEKKCHQFSSGIEGTMTDDAGFNRNDLDLSKFCQAFWSGPVTDAAKVQAQKDEEEDAAKAKEEAKAEEEKNNQALAATQAAQTEAVNEATNQANLAIQHKSEVDKQVEDLQAKMSADADEAAKLIDTARQEEQVASEKEAKAAEAKVATAESAAQADEAKALEEGDAQADAIAAKALEKANEAEPTEENAAAAKDEAEAIASGDEVAEKIADKAIKKEAALMVAKQQKVSKKNTTVTEKNTTVAKKVSEPKKVVAEAKKVTDAPVPKKGAEPQKEAKKVEVAKKF